MRPTQARGRRQAAEPQARGCCRAEELRDAAGESRREGARPWPHARARHRDRRVAPGRLPKGRGAWGARTGNSARGNMVGGGRFPAAHEDLFGEFPPTVSPRRAGNVSRRFVAPAPRVNPEYPNLERKLRGYCGEEEEVPRAAHGNCGKGRDEPRGSQPAA